MARYWLMKSEPGVFSIDDLAAAKEQTTRWDGVRNYQARNLLRHDIAVGDGVIFYHSSADPRRRRDCRDRARRLSRSDAVRSARRVLDRDSQRDDPRWFSVDIKFESKFTRPVTLPELRAAPALKEMVLLRRGSRLSVQPVTAGEWKQILKMGARK